MKPAPLHASLLAAVLAVGAWSAIKPVDGFTWWLEAAPVLLGGAILVATGVSA